MGRLYIGLVHHPVLDRNGAEVATSITGLDIHDIARTAMTFGVATYFVIEPLASQRAIAERIVRYWHELDDPTDPTRRAEAIEQVAIVPTLADSLARIQEAESVPPTQLATSARDSPTPTIGYAEASRRIATDGEPVYILFGTGWGLAPSVIDAVDGRLPPIRGPEPYNHLSVRAAAAITLDRLRGCRE